MGGFFDTRIGKRLETAQESGEQEQVKAAVQDVIDGAWKQDFEPGELLELAVFLQKNALHDSLVAVGNVAIETDCATLEMRRRYCQSLIEVGALHAAETELEVLVADPGLDATERGEVLGLLGRLREQRYINSNGLRPETSPPRSRRTTRPGEGRPIPSGTASIWWRS